MTTLCVDVPWNYNDGAPLGGTSVIAFSSNSTASLRPQLKQRVRLPSHLIGRKLKLKNYIYVVTPASGFLNPIGVIGYFKLQLSFGSRNISNSYLVSHSYAPTQPVTDSTVLEETIALPFFSTPTDFSGCWSTIQVPTTAETEMFIDVSVPAQNGVKDYGFSFLTLWFDVL